jgi:hypothetical protein
VGGFYPVVAVMTDDPDWLAYLARRRARHANRRAQHTARKLARSAAAPPSPAPPANALGAVYVAPEDLVTLLRNIVEKLDALQFRILEAEIDLQHSFEEALRKKRDRGEKLPIYLVVNKSVAPIASHALAVRQPFLSDLSDAEADGYWRTWVQCLIDVSRLTCRQEERLERLERAAAPRPDGGSA